VEKLKIQSGARIEEEASMPEVFAKVQEALHEAFGIDPQSVSLETGPDDVPNWDSVGHLSLATTLDRIFAITLDVDDIMAMENVRDIVQVVQSKLQA